MIDAGILSAIGDSSAIGGKVLLNGEGAIDIGGGEVFVTSSCGGREQADKEDQLSSHSKWGRNRSTLSCDLRCERKCGGHWDTEVCQINPC